MTSDNRLVVFPICNNEIVMDEDQSDLNIGTHKVVSMDNGKVNGFVILTCLEKNASGKSIYQVRLRRHLFNKNWMVV